MTEITVQGHRTTYDEYACEYSSCWDTIWTEDISEAIDHAEHTEGPVYIYLDHNEVFHGTPDEAASFLKGMVA